MSRTNTPPLKPIVNCHTHIFTSEHVPPLLAKSFVIWPLYHLLNLQLAVRIISWWIGFKEKKNKPNTFRKRLWRKLILIQKNKWIRYVYSLFRYIIILAIFWLSINALFVTIDWVSGIVSPGDGVKRILASVRNFLTNWWVLVYIEKLWVKISLVLVIMVFVKSARKSIFLILSGIWKFLKILPNKHLTELAGRYILLARYAFHTHQKTVFSKLQRQYPPKSKFVVLPMDMEYMKAGKVKKTGSYHRQLSFLNILKNTPKGKVIEPFLFIDPRRILDQNVATPRYKKFFGYKVVKTKGKKDRIELEKGTVVQDYMEVHKFRGFKIYPALGYYPFDEQLLPLWLYAVENELPIMTHCIKGTIFYRGKKDYDWNSNPVFKDANGHGSNRPLDLPERKNEDFTVNFTHPMNYLCLVHEPLLRVIISKSGRKTQELFGYKDMETPLVRDLKELKVCLAHFGGEEEWVRYLESDRSNYSQQLIVDRARGLELDINTGLPPTDPVLISRWNSLANIWKNVDWYSIICSLMIQYPNVYADISYILSKPRIYPLLEETLDKDLNPELYKKVLFGTDFYVVRNHNSEKDLLAEITAGLSSHQFDQIARLNPQMYLS